MKTLVIKADSQQTSDNFTDQRKIQSKLATWKQRRVGLVPVKARETQCPEKEALGTFKSGHVNRS